MRISYLMFIVLLAGFGSAYSQNSNCQVNMKSISGSYAGGCKKGLAHGSGRAEGLDIYEGGFKKDYRMEKEFMCGVLERGSKVSLKKG